MISAHGFHELLNFINKSKTKARKKGILLASAHYGNFFMPLLYLTLNTNEPVYFLIRKIDNPLFQKYITKYFAKLNIYFISRNYQGVKKAIELLKNGEILAILPDQNAAVGGIFVEFFKVPASTTKGLYTFWKNSDCEIYFCFDKPLLNEQ